MKKQALILTTIIFTLVTVTSAFAGNCREWKNRGAQDCPRFMDGPGQQWADLTPEQQTQIKALHQKFIDETAPQRVAMVSKHEAIRILMETSAPDRDQLVSLTNELADLQKTVMASGIDFTLEAKKIAPELSLPMIFNGMGMGKGHGMGMFPDRKKFHGKSKGQNAFPGQAACPQQKVCPKLPAEANTSASE